MLVAKAGWRNSTRCTLTWPASRPAPLLSPDELLPAPIEAAEARTQRRGEEETRTGLRTTDGGTRRPIAENLSGMRLIETFILNWWEECHAG